MKKLIGIMITIVVFLALLPTILTSTEEFNYSETTQTETAVNDETTNEVVALDNTPVSVDGVTVNGSALTLTTDYTVSGSNVTLLTDSSTTDDTIVITYTYELDVSTGVEGLVNILPILFAVIVVAGVVVAVKFKK